MGEDWTGAFPVEDALEMVLMFDGTGEITYANAAARSRLGYAPEGAEDGLRGRQMGEVFPGVFRFPGSVSGIPEGEERPHLVMYRRNRTCFPVEARFLRDPDRGIFVCMANDILEQEHLGREIEQVREEARQAARVKSEFVANVTHELRTPVNGILGNVRELLGGPLEEGRTAKALQLIERCCGDMNKIIDNILDFSKLEAGKFSLEPRKFHFRNMMDYVKSHHINKITEKGLEFFMTVSPQIPEYVIGDELRVVQILNNLLSNALKFTAIGKITVEVVKTARVNDKIELFFIVADTGIGFDKEDKKKLFQSFSQVDASISRKYGGTGLGLNICKQLVELMGGRIEVEGKKNRGSTFSFSIWVNACAGEEEPAAQREEAEIPFVSSAASIHEEDSQEEIRQYGTPENQENLKKVLSKLILCVEMENWEKAEMFMETVRQLTEEAPREVKRVILKLKMAIQKENYDKITAEFDALNSFL